jgi:hypothetical protein
MSNHGAKQWNYEDFKYFMDNKNVKSRMDLMRDLQRTKGAIIAMEIVSRIYAKNPDNPNVSKSMRSNFERYFNSNGHSKENQLPMIEEIRNVSAVDAKVLELDDIFNALRERIAEVVVLAVQQKLLQEREATANELKDLREFKNSVRKDSLFVQLTKRLNNIV